MADVSISKFTQLIRLQGQASVPSLPPSTEDTPPAVNPPGSGGLTGVNQFIQLTDTPATYSGATLNYARVNAGETGLEFRTPAQVLSDIGGIGGTIASGQVAFGTGTDTIGGDNEFTFSKSGSPPSVISTFAIRASIPVIRIEDTDVSQNVYQVVNGNIFYLSTSVSSTNSFFRYLYSNGFVSIGGAINPTETLDVNGTARIRTINNLGTTASRFLVADATGVLHERTASEVASDLSLDEKIDWLTRTVNNTSGDIDNLPTPTDYIEITGADAINGIVPTDSGLVRIVNKTGSELILRSNNGNATATNQLNIKFQFLPDGDGITLFYDRDSEKWLADDIYLNDVWEQFTRTSNTNNLPKSSATNRIRINGANAIELTGIANCQNGQLITVFNNKTENITIKNDSASSTDVNRFDIGSDIVLEPNRFLTFVHENGRLRRQLESGSVISGLTTNRIVKATSATSIGDGSLVDDSDGVYNEGSTNICFFGYKAGLNNSTGIQNTFFGNYAGLNNTIGTSNSFYGHNSGIANTEGDDNSFFALGSGSQNTTGFSNSFFGSSSGSQNTTGSRNSFFGAFAGRHLNGSGNSFFGEDAGRFINSGSILSSSDNSVFIGSNTSANANSETNQIVIGYGADGAGSNTVVLGNTSIVLTVLRGTVNMADLPTSSAGLNAGDLWNDSGTLKIA